MLNYLRSLLKQNRIYILPTTLGFYFLSIIFILFLISLSYAHSLAFTTTFIFVSIVMTSAIYTHYNLHNVELVKIIPPKEVFEGETAILKVLLKNNGNRLKFDLLGKIGDNLSEKGITIKPGEIKELVIPLKKLSRGHYKVERISLTTSFPFGIFYSWIYFNTISHFNVFPEIGEEYRFNERDHNRQGGSRTSIGGKEEFREHSKYSAFDSLNDLDWKAYARGRGLWTKQYDSSSIYVHEIRFDQMVGGSFDTKLSNTCRSLVECARSEGFFSLSLPHFESGEGRGQPHLDTCLRELAKWDRDEVVL